MVVVAEVVAGAVGVVGGHVGLSGMDLSQTPSSSLPSLIITSANVFSKSAHYVYAFLGGIEYT